MTPKTTDVTKLFDQGLKNIKSPLKASAVSGVPLGWIPMIGPFGQGISQ